MSKIIIDTTGIKKRRSYEDLNKWSTSARRTVSLLVSAVQDQDADLAAALIRKAEALIAEAKTLVKEE